MDFVITLLKGILAMAIEQYNIYPGLTPVRVVSTSNIAGTYFNGQNNNGVGATLTIAASSLTVDSVVLVVGDRVLLHTQTNTNEQGIYIVLSIGATVVLQRAADQQSIEQIRAGQFVTVGAGTVEAGNIFSIVEPLPAILGINALIWNADPSAGGVAFSGGASTANALAVFSNTSGDIKAASTTTTLGQALNITGALGVTGAILATGNITSSAGNLAVTAGTITASGNITTSAGNMVVTAGTITASGAIQSLTGNLIAGSSTHAASLVSFPASAANGTLIISALDAGGAFNTTIRNSAMGQSTVFSIPDVGAATGFIVANATQGLMKSVTAAAAAGGNAAQSFTDTFCTATSTVVGNWNTQTNAASVLKIVPGNGSFVVTSTADAGVGTFGYIIMK